MNDIDRIVANKTGHNYAITCLRCELSAITMKDMTSDTDYSKSITQLEEAIVVLEKKYEKPKKETTIPPSVDEVESYCDERNNGINPQAFIDFYQTRGWKVGKEKMKDWKAAIRTWENNKKEREATAKPSHYSTVKKDFSSGGIYESM